MRHVLLSAYISILTVAAAYVAVGDRAAQGRAAAVGLLVAAAAIAHGVRLYRPDRHRSWIFLGSALAAFGALILLQNLLLTTWGYLPFPGVFQVLRFASFLPFFAWAYVLIRVKGRLRHRGDHLDFVLMTAAFVVPLFFLVLKPIADHGTVTGAAKAWALTDPIVTAILLTLVLRLALTKTSSLALRLIVTGTAASAVASILRAALSLHAWDGISDRLPVALNFAAVLMTVVGALHPSMRAVEAPEGDTNPVARLGVARMLGMAAALFAPTATVLVLHLTHRPIEPVTIVLAVAVTTVAILLRVRDLLTQSEEARHAVERQEHYFRSIALNVSDALAVTDKDGALLDSSPAFSTTFGMWEPGERLHQLLPGSDVADLLVEARSRPWTTVTREVAWRDATGTRRWFDVTASNMLDDKGVNGVVWVLRDISERHAFTEELRHQALHDALTGLPNRMLLADRLDLALARAHRSNEPVAVLFVDVDNFKTINDGLGHDAGDRLLIAVAERLRSALRESDTLARLGGDEFAMVVEGLEETMVRELAERVRSAIAAPFDIGGIRIPVTGSVGVAFGRSRDAEALLRQADVAMYQAKATGKDAAVVFEAAMEIPATERLETELELLAALEHDEFALVYQPVVDVHSGTVEGAEALLRWHHPVKGEIQPLKFVPVAEECGLMVPIGRWVLRTACAEAATWRSSLSVSVNVSARQLESPTFTTDVQEALADAGLDPARLILEITESTVVRNVAGTIEKLTNLRSLGVRFAVDDFGTGYSSLGQLRRLAVDVLKIDRSFVAEVARSSSGKAMVQALLQMARALQLQTIAEGVEDAEQAAALRAAECEAAQGYYYARPMPVERFRAFVENAASTSVT